MNHSHHRHILLALLALSALLVLAACTPVTSEKIVEVTRIVTETLERPGEEVVVTRVVTETLEVTVTPSADAGSEEPARTTLIVCMAQEPETLYTYGGSMLAQAAVTHGFYENIINTASYDYQAQGIEKLPNLQDGDAVINEVEVSPGDTVADAAGNVVTLEEGVILKDAEGNDITYDGSSPLTLPQMSADFTFKPLVWEDGTPVTAGDSVYSFELVADPDTPSTKFTVDRTASYEATGDLSVRWTGIPGWLDSIYFLNVWQPLPRHAWGQMTAAEILESEEANRQPLANGPFRIQEWVAGDHITLVRNEHYYRAGEGLPRLDSVTFRFIPDTNQLLAQLLSNQCDIGTQDGLDASHAPFLLEAETSGLIRPYLQTGTVYEHIDFAIDTVPDHAETRPDWFQDVRVRQAMTLCTDRQGMVNSLLFGRSEVIHSYIPSVHPLYPTEGLVEWPYDVEQANALLDEIGFVDSDGDGTREYYAANVEGGDPTWDGTPFNITLGTTAGNDLRQQLTQIFQQNMLDCGISVELTYPPAPEFFADGPEGPIFGRQYDLGEFAWVTGIQPGCNLYLSSQIPGPLEEGFGGWGASNNTAWSNEAFDLACNTALGSLPGTADYEEQHMEAQRIFSEEVPVIPLFLRLKVAATRPEVCNFSVDPTENSEVWNLFEISIGNCQE